MPLRIALLGTDNTHGHQFAGFINGWSKEVAIPYEWKHGFLPEFYLWAKTLREAEHRPDLGVPSKAARVTSIWCTDTRSAALIARACGIQRVAKTPFDAMTEADAVLILTEDPSTHFELAKAAFERCLPTFIDKPLSPDVRTNEEIADIALRTRTPWFTGSSYRFSTSLKKFAAALPDLVGQLTDISVHVSGPLDLYGIHATEIANSMVSLGAVTHLQGFRSGHRGGALLTLKSAVTVLIETIETYPSAHAVVHGPRGIARWEPTDGYRAILEMSSAFIKMAESGISPVSSEESLLVANTALKITEAAIGASSDAPI
jgi:predicted dehydrogenase